MSGSVAFCPQCGIERWPGATFCAGCGFDIGSWEQSLATDLAGGQPQDAAAPPAAEPADQAPAGEPGQPDEVPAREPGQPDEAPAFEPEPSDQAPAWQPPAEQPPTAVETPTWSGVAAADETPTVVQPVPTEPVAARWSEPSVAPEPAAASWLDPAEPVAAPWAEPAQPPLALPTDRRAARRGASLPIVAASLGALLIVAVGAIAVFVLAGGTGNATPTSAAVAAPSSEAATQPGAATNPAGTTAAPATPTAPATPAPVTPTPATPAPTPSSDLAAGVWTSVQSMPRAVWGAATATLPDGSVLVAGGTKGGTKGSKSFGAVAQSAVFDASSHAWDAVGSMASRRTYADAAVISGGRVLVAGGSRDGVPLATAEIYDPSTRSWSPARPMTTPRTDYALVSLGDGRAMAIGGGHASGKKGATRTAEIYDPATNRWTRTGSMSVPRAYATANLLPDGRVLVAGGSSTYVTRSATRVWSSAEIWDPLSGAWSVAGSMSVPRTWQQGVTLADGRVLVTGGWIQPISSSIPPVTSTDVFDPDTNAWTPGPAMVDVRSQHGLVALPDGGAMAIGGTGIGNVPQTSVELLDAALAGWSEVAQLPVPVWYPAVAVLPGGIVLVSGGAVDGDGINATRTTALFPIR
jgi:Kelch motif